MRQTADLIRRFHYDEPLAGHRLLYGSCPQAGGRHFLFEPFESECLSIVSLVAELELERQTKTQLALLCIKNVGDTNKCLLQTTDVVDSAFK